MASLAKPCGDAVVFLDVDGVLNATTQAASRQDLDVDLLARWYRVVEAVPCQNVLSTSWRTLERRWSSD